MDTLTPVKFVLGLFLFCLALRAEEYPYPLDLGPTNTYGRELQYSMRLMANSPPQKKRTVKVLLYGQSVTQEIWSVWISDYLRQRFPNANLVITNLAVGYNAEFLSYLAPTDIADFYPDLMIFHNYGGLSFVESEIAAARRQTTTDILLQTDHIHIPEDLDEPTDPLTPGGLPERAYRNYVALPDIAQRYSAQLAFVRDHWKQYLRDFHLAPLDLLKDHIHPNWQGNFLMTELLKPYFRVDESFPSNSWANLETNYVIGRDVDWSDDLLTLDFVGNRVDLVIEDSAEDPVEVRIDGRRPSEFPELYHFSRRDWYPNTYWMSILEMTSNRPLLEEDWTAKITESSTNNGVPFARFQIIGSKTGFDGEGDITQRFVSNSGRVIIDPIGWLMLSWATTYYPILEPLPVGHEIHWKAIFSGKDEFTPHVPDPTLETTVTVAQGLGNGAHTLTLRRIRPTPITAIRVYNPLARPQPLRQLAPEITSLRRDNDRVFLTINVSGRYVVESSSDGSNWTAATAPASNPQVVITSSEHFQLFRVRALD